MADINKAPLTFNKDELMLLSDALLQAIASAQRQQNMKGRTLPMKEVMQRHELILRQLHGKIIA